MEQQQQRQPPMQAPTATAAGKKKKSKRMPSAQELVAHYEKQGMATEEASLKVIGDLQGALFRMIKSNSNSNSPVISAKLDAVHSRLLQLEAKLDSKPSYPQALAVGVASVSVWNGALQLWNAVRRVTSSDPPS